MLQMDVVDVVGVTTNIRMDGCNATVRSLALVICTHWPDEIWEIISLFVQPPHTRWRCLWINLSVIKFSASVRYYIWNRKTWRQWKSHVQTISFKSAHYLKQFTIYAIRLAKYENRKVQMHHIQTRIGKQIAHEMEKWFCRCRWFDADGNIVAETLKRALWKCR